MTTSSIQEGGCSCGTLRYRMLSAPLFVHCCHCSWCQRESGSAFAVNAMIEADRVEITDGVPVAIELPSASGKGQTVWRCPNCLVAVWSNYAGGGEAIRFVRAGTLDDTSRLVPDIHIYTDSKQPWVDIPEGQRAVPQYYRYRDTWPAESIERSKRAHAAAG